MSIRILIRRFLRWFSTPNSPEMDPENFRNVQIDAVGVGLASAAAPFLSIFLTRLGASTLQVGLLTTMPALTGLLFSIPLGQFLQRQTNIVPWFSLARLLQLSGYALTGIITFFLPEWASVIGILGIWALVTIPQTILNISFNVVMNSIAGQNGRYELMSHRWSILGFTTSVTAIFVGQFLDRIPFPLNYQLMFIALSVGGLISYTFSRRIRLRPIQKTDAIHPGSFRSQAREYVSLILREKPFVKFIMNRFVFVTGTTLAAPLFPIYFVRVLKAPDSWIAVINTAATAILIVGYFFWPNLTRRRGPMVVLLATTFGTSLYPILTGLTNVIWLIPLYAGIAGIFQAGLNLVFFDELMQRIPPEYSATFMAAAQSIQFLSTVMAPLIGTLLAESLGFSAALIISGCVSLVGVALFALEARRSPAPRTA
jgi:hypothetical protein